jgi:sugar/nucleoside kinase (ribokinase family)
VADPPRPPVALACLGDLVEDVIVRLDGPVNVASDTPAHITRRRGGSAANTAVAAAWSGHRSRFIGQVGDDAIGRALVVEMRAVGVDIGPVRRSGSTGTIVALVDTEGERSMLTDRRACIDLTDPDPSWLDEVTMLHVPFYSLVSGAIAQTASTMIGWAHERTIDVSIDASSSAVLLELGVDRVREHLERLRPDVLLANRDEAAVLDLRTAWPGAVTVVKRGPDPALVYESDGTCTEVAAVEITGIDDTTGAGDAFAAGFLTHATGWRTDPVGACRSGHRVAAAVLAARSGVTSRASS